MKSVGEVMAIGRTFEESLQKSIRMLEIGNDGLVLNRSNGKKYDEEDIENHLLSSDDFILYYVAVALKKGMSVEKINKISSIDPWFIEKIKNIVETEQKLKESKLEPKLLREAKKLGFSDKQTLAAEWPAKTNYLYLTYGGDKNDLEVSIDEKGLLVLGAGPYRIGSSVEFDWGTVNMVWGLQENGEKNIAVVNCNPETVSTDYDICERLYFEELTLERILDIHDFENPKGIITSVGGQTANNLTPKLAANGIHISSNPNGKLFLISLKQKILQLK
jgi:carbamoyl-phosphate synthase large subunit